MQSEDQRTGTRSQVTSAQPLGLGEATWAVIQIWLQGNPGQKQCRSLGEHSVLSFHIDTGGNASPRTRKLGVWDPPSPRFCPRGLFLWLVLICILLLQQSCHCQCRAFLESYESF